MSFAACFSVPAGSRTLPWNLVMRSMPTLFLEDCRLSYTAVGILGLFHDSLLGMTFGLKGTKGGACKWLLGWARQISITQSAVQAGVMYGRVNSL